MFHLTTYREVQHLQGNQMRHQRNGLEDTTNQTSGQHLRELSSSFDGWGQRKGHHQHELNNLQLHVKTIEPIFRKAPVVLQSYSNVDDEEVWNDVQKVAMKFPSG